MFENNRNHTSYDINFYIPEFLIQIDKSRIRYFILYFLFEIRKSSYEILKSILFYYFPNNLMIKWFYSILYFT